jgi:outer membrane biosynthesis protein TonB
MQITLNQVEIEEAITNYVNDLVSVNEGMTITITIKATRGEEGTTALIDIVPEVAELEVVEPVKAAVKPARKTATKAAAVPAKEEPVAEAQPEPVVKEAEPEPEAEPVKEEEAPQAPAEEPVVDDEKPEVLAAAAPKSLFANLRKPNNG